ncbi:MAG TPA: alpha/beta hydrolase [Nakamurella sp.]|jgi:pimeloyl-ACP methyl ester carboxylesterase
MNCIDELPGSTSAGVDPDGQAGRPDWFDSAVSVDPDIAEVEVDGARISYRAWGEPSRPGIVLVHGGAANACWWDHVAPWLCTDRRVVALDLSGHGHSDHRERYDCAQWADEVLAVAAAAGVAARPVVVGHSLGGFVTLQVAQQYGASLTGIVVIDSPVRGASPEGAARLRGRAGLTARTYPTVDEIVGRFRPLPQDTELPCWLRDYLGLRSVRPVVDGYPWQFDPRIFAVVGLTPDDLTELDCAVALVRGERGFLSPGMSRELAARIGPDTLEVTVAGSGHHVMLDQPMALTAELEAIATQWLPAGPGKDH